MASGLGVNRGKRKNAERNLILLKRGSRINMPEFIVELKKFIDYDKSNSKIFINYFIEDSKILIKVALKNDVFNNDNDIIIENFDISNKIFLTNIP